MIDETTVLNKIDDFVRNSVGEFTTNMVNSYLQQNNFNTSNLDDSDIAGFITAHPSTLKISKNTFTTRAAVFLNQPFIIKPLPTEIERGILIPGHRIMPFADPEKYPFRLLYYYNNKLIRKIDVDVPIADFLETNYLFGEEYIPQLLDADPANTTFDITNADHVLPNNVHITALNMEDFYKKNNFKEGDRIICKVFDWAHGVIELNVQKSTKENPFEITNEDELQATWQKDFSEALKETFKTHGPLGSIEEQLANTFATHSEKLCTNYCKSIEECLTEDKSVSINYYGVECRLWETDEEIPAMGPWNENVKESTFVGNTLYEEIGIPIPYYMLDAYVLDALYKNDTDLSKIVNKMIPDPDELEEDQLALFLLLINERYDTMQEKYNKFSDFEKGDARSRTLALYSDLVDLICFLDNSGSTIESLPQQQLVILSQLFSHTTKFLDLFMSEETISKSDLELIVGSLDGMEDGFEDISMELRQAVALGTNNNGGFTVI